MLNSGRSRTVITDLMDSAHDKLCFGLGRTLSLDNSRDAVYFLSYLTRQLGPHRRGKGWQFGSGGCDMLYR